MMSTTRNKYATKEEAAEARRAQVRAGVAAHKAKMASLSRVEQAAWKGREVLGEGFEPYTAAERAEVDRLKGLRDDLIASAARLNASLKERLEIGAQEDPRLKGLLEAVQGAAERIQHDPF